MNGDMWTFNNVLRALRWELMSESSLHYEAVHHLLQNL